VFRTMILHRILLDCTPQIESCTEIERTSEENSTGPHCTDLTENKLRQDSAGQLGLINYDLFTVGFHEQ